MVSCISYSEDCSISRTPWRHQSMLSLGKEQHGQICILKKLLGCNFLVRNR